MLVQRNVRVLSVTLVTDVFTGNLVYQVTFGDIGKPIEGVSPPSVRQIASNVLTLFLPSEGKCPYIAGTQWSLKIEDQGAISVVED